MQVFSLVQSLVISGFIIGQQVGMKSMNQIFQYYLRLHGHTLIEGFLTHIAIDYSFLAKSAKVGITRVQRLQGIVRECSVVTVDDAPIVGTLRPTLHRLEIQCHTARTRIVFQEIVCTGIPEQFGKETLSAYRIPVAATHFTAEHHRTLFYTGSQFF